LLYLFSLPILLLFISLLQHLLYRNPSNLSPFPFLFNGTHFYHHTTLLISLDGFPSSYFTLHSSHLQNLLNLSQFPIRAKSIQPVFPTLTFPNYWSLITRLYPENHGILGNDFWDPETGEEFLYTDEEKS